MTTKELLLKAARVLKKRGWTTRALQDDKGQVCAVGALAAVATGYPTDTYAMEDDRTVRCALRRILKAAGRPLSTPGQEWHGVVDWNNYACQSKDEIIDVFTKAAALK